MNRLIGDLRAQRGNYLTREQDMPRFAVGDRARQRDIGHERNVHGVSVSAIDGEFVQCAPAGVWQSAEVFDRVDEQAEADPAPSPTFPSGS